MELIATALDYGSHCFTLFDQSMLACSCKRFNESAVWTLQARIASSKSKINGDRYRLLNAFVSECNEKKDCRDFKDSYLSLLRTGDVIYDPGRLFVYNGNEFSSYFMVNLVLKQKNFYLAGKCPLFPGFSSSVPRYVLVPPRTDII